jgi:hypothetical protein
MTKVIAHLVDVEHPKIKNPCNEISLPVLMEPKEITWLRLQGRTVFDYTESLKMEPELVDKSSITRYSPLNTIQPGGLENG